LIPVVERKIPIVNEKKLIGLTGLYCAGKNHVALLLEQRGLPVLDADKLGHAVIEMEKECLLSRFGAEILGEGGLVDRKRLGAKVFGRPGELAALENIIHPRVNRETLEWIKTRKEKACVINAALLHRSSAFNELDAVIVVEASFLIRLLRARRRDHLPLSQLVKRFRSQSDFDTQYFKGKTDIYRVSNSSGCPNSGCPGSRAGSLRNKLENRINEILSREGIT